jgi:Xaa-Pro aminopeptidase
MKKTISILGFVFALLSTFVYAGQQFEKAEYAARRTRLMAEIPDGIAVILGARNVTGYWEFFQNNDFMYFCGVDVPNAALIIDGVAKESLLFFDLTEREAKGENLDLQLIENPAEFTGVERHYPRERFSDTLARLAERREVLYTSFKPEELMRECSNEKFRALRNDMLLDEWDGRLTRELQFVQHLKQRFPQTEVKDCSQSIWGLRMLKSPAEIQIMRKAGRIGVQALIEMMKATRPGIYEYEIAALYEYMCRRQGVRELAYMTIISSEENHPYLHYHKHNRLLGDGDFLVVDAGPDVGHYDVDISISYPANGKFSPRQKEIYTACYEMEKACISLYKPGITSGEVHAQVMEILKNKGFDLETDIFKIITRGSGGGCSHYVGMAVHDVGGGPRGVPLKPGMVFACDILAVFPKENLGVRVEDTVLITEDGCENLTAGLPRTVKEIESLMQKPGIIQILDNKQARK